MKFSSKPPVQGLVPLSEDERLVLMSPRFFRVQTGESHNWDEATSIVRGEKRAISLDLQIEKNARGQMVRIFYVPDGARLNIFHHVRVEAGASWRNVICVRGGGEVQIRRTIEVFGPKAEVSLSLLGQMENSGRISVADEIFSYAKEAKLDLRTKIVLNHEARSEARARIVIDQNSMQTIAYEVNIDEVVCGHAATTSRPRESELFYLTSKGLALADAEKLLARGFLMAGLTELHNQATVDSIQKLFA
jgi:Fe-S cluster assembly scaffold protein SufB